MDENITNEKYNEIEIHEMQEAKSFQKIIEPFLYTTHKFIIKSAE